MSTASTRTVAPLDAERADEIPAPEALDFVAGLHGRF